MPWMLAGSAGRTGLVDQAVGHTVSTGREAVGQLQAAARVTIDFPEALAAEGERDPTHEGGHILEGITEKNPNFMGKSPARLQARPQLGENAVCVQGGLVASPAQHGHDVGPGEEGGESLVPVNQQEQGLTAVYHDAGRKAAVDQQVVTIFFPEQIEIAAAGLRSVDHVDEVGRLDAVQDFGGLQRHERRDAGAFINEEGGQLAPAELF